MLLFGALLGLLLVFVGLLLEWFVFARVYGWWGLILLVCNVDFDCGVLWVSCLFTFGVFDFV